MKSRMFPRYLLCFLLFTFLLHTTGIKAQTTSPADTTVIEEYDDEEVVAPPLAGDQEAEEDEENSPNIMSSEVYISPDSVQLIKRQPAFAYMAYLDSFLKAEQRLRDRQPPPPPETTTSFRPSLWDNGIVKVLCWFLAIGVIGFILYRLFLSQGIFVRNTQQTVPDIELDNLPNETDLEKGLRVAIAQQDYRLGVRFLFLITLSRLGEKNLLQLAAEKTNYQYANELSGKIYANDFAQLSLQYEYVWFGNFPITETQFSTIQQQHQQFLKQV